MEKTMTIENLTAEQAKWYTGIERNDLVKISLAKGGWFPIELFCRVKNGKYDIASEGFEKYGMLRAFCGSAGMVFQNGKINQVKKLLVSNGYIINHGAGK